MKLPDDLKNWKAPEGFNLFTPDQAFVIILGCLAAALLLDRLQVWGILR